MSQVIRIADNLYKRLEKHASGFDTPANVIEKILDYYEGVSGQREDSVQNQTIQPLDLPTSVEIVYYPAGADNFKQALLKTKTAYIRIYKTDGSSEFKEWNASRFTQESDVNNNLRSGYLRDWKKRGIVKAEVAVNRNDIQLSKFDMPKNGVPMDEQELIRKLRSVGMAAYVTYFDLFQSFSHGNISKADCIEKLVSDGVSNDSGASIRCGNADLIFRAKMECSALKLVVNSKRLQIEILKKARELIQDRCR